MPQYDPGNPANRGNDPITWFVDSGCSGHMTHDLSLFHEYHELHATLPIEFRGGDLVPGVGYGNITLPNGMQIINVLHVPAPKVNLLSISAMLNLGLDVLFRATGRNVVFLHGYKVIMTGPQYGSFFTIDMASTLRMNTIER